jgi:hypothetical protein
MQIYILWFAISMDGGRPDKYWIFYDNAGDARFAQEFAAAKPWSNAG